MSTVDPILDVSMYNQGLDGTIEGSREFRDAGNDPSFTFTGGAEVALLTATRDFTLDHLDFGTIDGGSPSGSSAYTLKVFVNDPTGVFSPRQLGPTIDFTNAEADGFWSLNLDAVPDNPLNATAAGRRIRRGQTITVRFAAYAAGTVDSLVAMWLGRTKH